MAYYQAMQPVRYLKQHVQQLRQVLFVVSWLPALLLLWAYWQDQLGINKLNTLLHTTGLWALNFLIITLAVTPIRKWGNWLSIKARARYGKRMSDWNWIIQLRRMLGLFSFFYATLHMLIYVILDQALDWPWIIEDIQERPFILVGILVFVILSVLAVTSTDNMIRRLGARWREIHRWVYAAGVGAVLHYLWLSKVGVYDAYSYALVLAVLLGYRLWAYTGWWQQRVPDTGMEVPER